MESLSKQKKYLLACSYGPDSMALFDMLMKKGISFAVAHVNYHMRGEESDQESESLENYCYKNNIPFKRKDVEGLLIKENFESKAREIRYDFFKEICDSTNEEMTLLTGHNEDDIIETYIMQKMRQKYVSYYGIRQRSNYQGMQVYRPVLQFSKHELENYCLQNKVPFGIDSSNLTKDYTRNIIRHEQVAKLNKAEREAIILEIKKLNGQLLRLTNELKQRFNNFDFLYIPKLKKLSENVFHIVVYNFFARYQLEESMSGGWVETIYEWCESKKPNISEKVSKDFFLLKEYAYLRLMTSSDLDVKDYEYELTKPDRLQTDVFCLDFSLPPVRGSIKEESYPLTIRNTRSGDCYEINGRVKPLNRVFIDWKVPLRLRKLWPVFVDKSGIIVYVPRYRGEYEQEEETNLIIYLR